MLKQQLLFLISSDLCKNRCFAQFLYFRNFKILMYSLYIIMYSLNIVYTAVLKSIRGWYFPMLRDWFFKTLC